MHASLVIPVSFTMKLDELGVKAVSVSVPVPVYLNVTFVALLVVPSSSTAANVTEEMCIRDRKILVGTDSLTATYNGDAKNGKSTSPAIAQTVSQAAISMTLASSPNPSSSGQSVKFTATLTSTGGLPIGDVSFTFGSTTLGTASINTKGVATLSTKALPTGTDKVTASCAGDTNYSPASASVTQTVN